MSDTPPLPPPGTVTESFWQRSATQAAFVVTIGLGLQFVRALITGAAIDPARVADAVEASTWAWLGAVGIHAVGKPGLRVSP